MTQNTIQSSTGVEHTVWVEDWTNDLDTDAYINSLPKGVDTIDIFVGQLDANGEVDGFTANTPGTPPGTGAFANQAQLTDFIAKCKAQGINVQLSIGGQSGTTFGDSWQNLTASNIGSYAQALNNLCTATGASGIDFDEEMEDTTVAANAGKLAAALKNLNGNLNLSYCVFMGTDTTNPGHPANLVFLQNAMLSNGTCAIDHVKTMPYYDGLTLDQNETQMTAWKNWLEKNCNMSASQLSAGVDPNDPNTSLGNGSLNQWIQFAQAQGFSTSIWDQEGVSDYVNNDWGTVISDIYNGIPVPPRPSENLSFTSYTIQSGDTFYAIAQKLDTSVDLLEKLNPTVDPNKLTIGQQLEVPGYTIQSGDSLYAIASEFDTTVADLEALNPGVNPSSLQIGQIIVIHQVDALPAHFNANYTIISGDTLSAIASEFNTTVAELEALNPGVNPNNLQIGQIIKIKE